MYKFSDISESEVPGGDGKMSKGRGCYVSAATGIVITLLAIAIAVGVGLIVHFAENRKLECNFPDVHVDGVGKIQPQTGDRQTEQPDTPKPTQKPRAGAQSKSTAAIVASSASATPCPTLPSTSGPSTTSKAPPTLKDVRLPTALKPTHYILKLTPHMYGNDPSKFTFEGHVKIEMNCTEPTSNVTLHINQLNVSSPRFASTSDDHSPRYVSHTEDKERQFLIVQLDKQTTGGQTYFLEMDFVGPLKDDLKGLYLSTYKNAGKTVYAAATQFEPTDARKAFPCFDEPQLKATFEVTLVRKNTLKSISNMPKTNSVRIANNMVEDHYQTSAVMSTYLLAFIVGNFEFTAANTSNGLLYRAWSIPDSVEQTHTALDVGIKTIVNYENYFGIKFPLPKQDMIAIPDFAAGAMENWGLITYRETAMLFQPGVSSERNLQRVTTVITHELGHQWFGDLVTMRWWDDLWLNEGFATFVECMGADFIHPDWKMYEQFVVDEVHDVLDFDGLATSHPIYVPVNNPDEINEIFDRISYAKGGSVIRMMRFVLGDETFRKGIQLYLTRRQYHNAFHDDLWEALTNQSTADGHPVNVKEVMDTWILQMNYPVVRVTAKNNKVNIQQSRFLSAPDAKDPGKYTSRFGYKWKIPFTYTTCDNPRFNATRTDIHWLNDASLDISHTGVQDEDWILGNIQQYGFYRVTYEDRNWMALVAQLKRNHERIHVINRAQLINDAWSLARASQLSTNIALSTLEYLNKELEYVPWVAAQRQLSYLDSMLSKTDLYGQFENFMKAILADPFKHYGMDDSNSTHIETYIRSDIVNLACSYGITECITKAKQLFQQWMKNPTNNPIDPDLRDTVYCTAIAEGSQEEWDFAFDQFKLAEVASEKATLMKALACSKSTWILSRYLNIAITPTEVRKQDATKVLVYISENSVGQALAWDFVRSNWNYLLNEYGKGVFSFTKLIAGLTSSFNTEFQLTQLNDFLAKNPYMGTGTRAFQQAKEKTQTNIKWMTQNKQIVANWLKTVQTSNVKARATDIRLPQHLIPYTYDVTLQPNMYSGDPADFTFDGYVKIYMDAKETGSNVTIHTNKLTIDEASIKFGREDGVTGGPVYTGERSHDDERQFEIFALDKEVSVGDKYYIEMNFTGPLIGDLAGLYLSQYQRGNDTVYIATTQMEATDARKAFPCFDEPEIKASFNVKLVRKRHMKSISNMPIIGNETLANDFVVDIYNTSARMSTYLIAFIVCDFEYTEDTTAKGIKYRAWARPESVNQTKVALAAGVKIIDYYEDYFGIDYPLPKQDMIAIPDFAAGAMENWGLITYRETAMLYEDGVSSESNLQRVNVVIAHELAHQWFGDLVTMDWWDDLWLNEGFATFVEYMGVDHLHPDYKMFEQFVFDIYEVFEIDSLVTSHPIYVPVANPEEINEIFDSISYAKGGSVLRMMRFFLGEKVFQEGVQIYLKSKEYANAKHDDLWAGLEQAARKANQSINVQRIMDTWILQMNYPVINVTRSSSGKIQIEQKRFLTNPDAIDPGKYPSPFNYTWKVPFTYTTKTNPNFNQTSKNVIWLEDKQRELPGTYPAPGDWILGNIQEYGIYRVNYEESNWGMLNKQLKDDHKVIDVINRAQIINDAFGLAKAEQLSMDIALQTLEYLQDEEEYVPWVAAGSELNYIDTMLSESSIYGLFEKFMKAKVEKQFERLGLNNTGSDHLTTYIRSIIASKACGYGNDKCTTEADKLYKKYMTTKINPIDPNLKSTVYCTALRTGGEEEWQFAFERYKSATVAAEKSRLLSALSCTREPWLLYRLLDLTLQPDVIRKQDAYKVYVSVGSNKVGTLVGWNFFREKWDRIFQEYGTGSFSLSDIIKGVTATFNTEFLLQQMKTFKAEHPDMGSGTRAYSQAIENVEANILWMNKNYQTVKDWLERTTNV